MKLYYFETPNSRKPCSVARYLDLPVEMIRVDLQAGAHKSPEMLALNPNGKLPVLVDDETSIWESNAIMLHMAQKAGSALWPSSPPAQVDVLKWLSWDMAHLSRHGGALLFENLIKSAFKIGEPDADAVAEATGFFKQSAAVLNDHLRGRSFISTDQLTLADFSVASMLSMAEPGRFPMEDFEQINRWYEEMMEIAAMAEPWPK